VATQHPLGPPYSLPTGTVSVKQGILSPASLFFGGIPSILSGAVIATAMSIDFHLVQRYRVGNERTCQRIVGEFELLSSSQ